VYNETFEKWCFDLSVCEWNDIDRKCYTL
jgi:hypothetical protein